jgi:tetratricopeptide (TPR) repeat protein
VAVTLRGRLAEHLAATHALEDDEEVLRHSARLLRELADEVRARPSCTLGDVVPADDPLDAALHQWLMNLVRNLAAAGLGDLAVEAAETLLELDPGNDVAHATDLAVALAELGRGEEAVRLVQERADAWPHDAEAWVGLFEVYRTLGDDRLATAALQRAVDMAQEHGEFGHVSDLLARFDDDS